MAAPVIVPIEFDCNDCCGCHIEVNALSATFHIAEEIGGTNTCGSYPSWGVLGPDDQTATTGGLGAKLFCQGVEVEGVTWLTTLLGYDNGCLFGTCPGDPPGELTCADATSVDVDSPTDPNTTLSCTGDKPLKGCTPSGSVTAHFRVTATFAGNHLHADFSVVFNADSFTC